MIEFLAPSSFVPFETAKLSSPALVWTHDQALADWYLEHFSYVVPGDDDAHAGKEMTKTFWAERYGGIGVSGNGGGVRCGNLHGFQVKGIGRNPLAGRNVDPYYTHGGATLAEAIREAIWGEVCDIALPYGAVRVRAIIESNPVKHFTGQDVRMVRGALIVRDAALRPAHYMRAPYYRPALSMACGHPSDADRTRSAVEGIGDALAALLGQAMPVSPDGAFIAEGLKEIARRCARQLAAARRNRLVHGALGCSNIAFDGRYIDYHTLTTVSDYRRIIVARLQPDMMNEHRQLIPTFANLAFYCRKYLPEQARHGLPSEAELVGYFLAQFNAWFDTELLKLTGIPERALLAIDPKIRDDAAAVFRRIIKSGDCEPFKLYTPRTDMSTWKMPEAMGDYHLNSILAAAALCGTRNMLDDEISALLPDDALRRCFVDAFMDLRDAYFAGSAGAVGGQPALFMAINARRLNDIFPELYQPVLNREIDRIMETEQLEHETAMLIARLSDKARTVMADPMNGEATLSAWSSRILSVSEIDGLRLDGTTASLADFLSALNVGVLNDRQKNMLAELCR